MLVFSLHLPAEPAVGQGGVAQQRHSLIPTQRAQVPLHLPREQRVAHLQRDKGGQASRACDGDRPLQLVGAEVGAGDPPHLALHHQLVQRLQRLLDGRGVEPRAAGTGRRTSSAAAAATLAWMAALLGRASGPVPPGSPPLPYLVAMTTRSRKPAPFDCSQLPMALSLYPPPYVYGVGRVDEVAPRGDEGVQDGHALGRGGSGRAGAGGGGGQRRREAPPSQRELTRRLQLDERAWRVELRRGGAASADTADGGRGDSGEWKHDGEWSESDEIDGVHERNKGQMA